jgi:hypothetical protein
LLLTTREGQRRLVEAITDLGEQSHPLEQLERTMAGFKRSEGLALGRP